MDLTNKDTLIKCLKQNGIRAKKYFGQNFLINKEILNKVVQAGDISKKDHIVEIGPGLGTLTIELSKKAKKVTTIEADKYILPALKMNILNYKNIEIINLDALKYIPPSDEYKVVANIPYQITSPLLTLLLTAKNKPRKIVFLIQKEVAEKICSKSQTVLSLQVQIYGNPRIMAKVSADSFYPAPKVESAILLIDIYPKPLVKNPGEVMRLAKKAFTLKRKKISNSLSDYKETLKKLGLNDLRPEKLLLQDWERLVDAIECKKDPFSLVHKLHAQPQHRFPDQTCRNLHTQT